MSKEELQEEFDEMCNDPVFSYLKKTRMHEKLYCSICNEELDTVVVFDYESKNYKIICEKCLPKIKFEDVINE